MTRKGLGITVIVDDNDQIQGAFTDGDLRRTLDNESNIHQTTISEVMTSNCKTITGTALAAEAVKMMEDFKINALPVVDENNQLIGLLNMHDLLRARVV